MEVFAVPIVELAHHVFVEDLTKFLRYPRVRHMSIVQLRNFRAIICTNLEFPLDAHVSDEAINESPSLKREAPPSESWNAKMTVFANRRPMLDLKDCLRGNIALLTSEAIYFKGRSP